MFKKIKQFFCKHSFKTTPKEIFKNDFLVTYVITCDKCGYLHSKNYPNLEYNEKLLKNYGKTQKELMNDHT